MPAVSTPCSPLLDEVVNRARLLVDGFRSAVFVGFEGDMDAMRRGFRESSDAEACTDCSA